MQVKNGIFLKKRGRKRERNLKKTLQKTSEYVKIKASKGIGEKNRFFTVVLQNYRKGKKAMAKTLTASYEGLSKIVKIILQIFFGGLIGGIYRIIRFTETGNVVTLIVGILCLVTGVGNFIAWIVDLITEITSNRITVLAD